MKSKIKTILPIAVALVLFFALSLVIYLNSHVFFVWFENSGMFLDPVEVSRRDGGVNYPKYALSELAKDGKVTIDQSMMLVNTEYMLSDDFVPDISEYKDTDVYMSEAIAAPFGCFEKVGY